MDTLDSASAQARKHIAIYDRRDVGSVYSLDCQERVAACYRWASARGYAVLDQYIAWGDVSGALPTALSQALEVCAEVCAAAAASLLVYAPECVGKDAALIDAAAERLGSLAVLFVVAEPDSAEREAIPC